MPFMNRQYEVDANQTGARRMFRAPLTDFKRQPRGNGNGNGRNVKAAPPEVTNAETFYYLKQMNSKTPIVIVMTYGEEIRGCIEWYARACPTWTRGGAPNR